jgi:hypothetical protein
MSSWALRAASSLDLDRQQQFRNALDLVDHHHARVVDEPDGIGDRRLPDQRQV